MRLRESLIKRIKLYCN